MSSKPVLQEGMVVLAAGPLLVGYMINFVLYGILSLQVYIYYIAFPADKVHNKVLVYTIYLLETVQTIFIAHDNFTIFVKGFGDFYVLTRLHYAWLTLPIIGGLAALVVQCFYAYRIMVLSQSKVVPTLIVVFSILQGTGAFMCGILSGEVDNILMLTTPSQLVGHIIWDGSSAICDVLIASYMCYFLMTLRVGFKDTQAVVSRVLQVTIGTGTLTATIAIVDLILFLVDYKRGSLFMAPCAVLGKLYSNSMMVLFNSRVNISMSKFQKTTETVEFAMQTGLSSKTGRSRSTSTHMTRLPQHLVSQHTGSGDVVDDAEVSRVSMDKAIFDISNMKVEDIEVYNNAGTEM